MNALTIQFRLFGIQTTIQPMAWLILALLGGAFSLNSAEGLPHLLIFVVAGMLCILFHEFGHALTAKKLAGAHPEIVIAGFSGYATHAGARFTRWSYFATVAAGPALGLLPAFIVVLVLTGMSGSFVGTLDYFWSMLTLRFTSYDPATVESVSNYLALLFSRQETLNFLVLDLLNQLFFISTVWTVFNLVPIYPLDGNKLLGTLINSDYIASGVGVVLTIPLFIWAVQAQLYFTVFIVLILGYSNYQFYMALRRMRR